MSNNASAYDRSPQWQAVRAQRDEVRQLIKDFGSATHSSEMVIIMKRIAEARAQRVMLADVARAEHDIEMKLLTR